MSFNISSKNGYSYIGTTSASSPATVTIPSSFQVRDSEYEYRGLRITSLPTKSIAVIAIGYLNSSPMTHVAHPYFEQLTSQLSRQYNSYNYTHSKYIYTTESTVI